MSDQDYIDILMKNIVDKYDYERMFEDDFSRIDKNLSYDGFVNWNKKCINESSNDDKLFFVMICKKINNKELGQMDMESCVVFDSSNVYFDKNKKLIIVNPR